MYKYYNFIVAPTLCCRQHITDFILIIHFHKSSCGSMNTDMSEFGCFMLKNLQRHVKDTFTNQSKFDFGEEVYKEIHKQAHLKET